MLPCERIEEQHVDDLSTVETSPATGCPEQSDATRKQLCEHPLPQGRRRTARTAHASHTEACSDCAGDDAIWDGRARPGPEVADVSADLNEKTCNECTTTSNSTTRPDGETNVPLTNACVTHKSTATTMTNMRQLARCNRTRERASRGVARTRGTQEAWLTFSAKCVLASVDACTSRRTTKSLTYPAKLMHDELPPCVLSA